jgi:hypothetical protein
MSPARAMIVLSGVLVAAMLVQQRGVIRRYIKIEMM